MVSVIASLGACGGSGDASNLKPQTFVQMATSTDLEPSVRDARLLDGLTGWALSDDALSITTDGGNSWSKITPPDARPHAIRGVFFADGERAWVVAGEVVADGATQLTVYRTANGGGTWSSTPLGEPEVAYTEAATGGASIDFVDPDAGWIAVQLVSSAAFSSGVLYSTSDGGTTWSRLSIPVGGRIEFATRTSGWASSGQPGGGFYVTKDGGKTWEADSVVPPSSYNQEQLMYGVPTFTAPTDGVLPITVAASSPNSPAAAFYVTHDGGQTWTLATSRPVGESSGQTLVPTSIVGAESWVEAPSDDHVVTEITEGGGEVLAEPVQGIPLDAGIVAISFRGLSYGWARASRGECAGFKVDCSSPSTLYTTGDGGKSWTPLSPP